MAVSINPLLDGFLSSGGLVPLALVVACIVFVMLSLRQKHRQHASREEQTGPRSAPAAASPQDRMRRDLESLLVELQELARKISAQIDTRFAKLEAVIRDADRRIATLNRLTRQFQERGLRIGEDGPGVDIRHVVVYELADAGLSPVEIAKELGKTPGEVELILNLRKQTKSASASKD